MINKPGKVPGVTLLPLFIFIFLALVVSSQAQEPADCNANYKVGENILPCELKKLNLGTSLIEVRIYTKKLPGQVLNKTFIVVHNDEQTGLNAVKEIISQKGGRLVELIPNKKGSRYLRLKLENKEGVCVDPNRIYTDKGIEDDLQVGARNDGDCKNLIKEQATKEINLAPVRNFAKNLQDIIQDRPGSNYKFIVAVHNNTDGGCLTFSAFDKNAARGDCTPKDKRSYEIQTEKVLASTPKDDVDNFIIATTPQLFDALKNKGFNIILQVAKEKLTGDADDGSMSVYASLKDLRYVILETECKDNNQACRIPKAQQKKMIETVLLIQ